MYILVRANIDFLSFFPMVHFFMLMNVHTFSVFKTSNFFCLINAQRIAIPRIEMDCLQQTRRWGLKTYQKYNNLFRLLIVFGNFRIRKKMYTKCRAKVNKYLMEPNKLEFYILYSSLITSS